LDNLLIKRLEIVTLLRLRGDRADGQRRRHDGRNGEAKPLFKRALAVAEKIV
jgi:hypothetical protein